MDMQGKSFKGQFKAADRAGAKYVFLIGEDEMNNQTITMKNTETREQTTVPADDLIAVLDAAFNGDEEDEEHDHHHHDHE